ncbi:RnfABCDGE type electron transport complex subunit B [Variovorax robiniae]|uniref:RnfABCDGE type electron transport complex subunit B n=1 Tax=Variovorax robiniae TaxID=1836199 RepID=A0ABU8XI28_9BURK
MTPLAVRIHAALPQTQCTRCGYPDCAGYAEAVASGEAGIHQCPPGGAEGIERLAAITGKPPRPLGVEFGVEGPRRMAVIDEAWCIGCTLCLDACPTDAILGMHKRMHTVIEPHCTGCELCIPVCPVDCISLEDVTPGRSGWQAWSQRQADEALKRYSLHATHRPARGPQDLTEPAEVPVPPVDRKRAIVEAALARARAAAARTTTKKP